MLQPDRGGPEIVLTIRNDRKDRASRELAAENVRIWKRIAGPRMLRVLAVTAGCWMLTLLTVGSAGASECQTVARTGKPGLPFIWAPASGGAVGYWITVRHEDGATEWLAAASPQNAVFVPLRYGLRVRVQVRAFDRNGHESLASEWSDCVELVYDGDCNGDGIVGSPDLACLMPLYGKQSIFDCTGDFIYGGPDLLCFWTSFGRRVD